MSNPVCPGSSSSPHPPPLPPSPTPRHSLWHSAQQMPSYLNDEVTFWSEVMQGSRASFKLYFTKLLGIIVFVKTNWQTLWQDFWVDPCNYFELRTEVRNVVICHQSDCNQQIEEAQNESLIRLYIHPSINHLSNHLINKVISQSRITPEKSNRPSTNRLSEHLFNQSINEWINQSINSQLAKIITEFIHPFLNGLTAYQSTSQSMNQSLSESVG